MNPYVRSRILPLIFVIALFIILFARKGEPKLETLYLEGRTMGPIEYHVKYLSSTGTEYQAEVDSILQAFNQSLSTYISDSELSRFNRADSLAFESPFMHPVLVASRQAYELTDGAFDPTVGPLVNAWGFGPGKQPTADTAKVDSLKEFVGYHHISFTNSYVVKDAPGVYLDFSAVAKGFAVDLVGEFLSAKGISNFMVEIGGEVVCRGMNEKGEPWLIGVDNPDLDAVSKHIAATVHLQNRALATSGNYRNYYEIEGKRYAHTIDPATGRPVQHSLLSASVFAADCMTADALATACMVMGLEKSVELFEQHPELDAIFLYNGADGNTYSYATSGIRAQIKFLLFPYEHAPTL